MMNWEKNGSLGAYESIQKMQEQLQASMKPFLRQKRIMLATLKSSRLLSFYDDFAIGYSSINMMTAIDTISKSMCWKTKIEIPQTAFDAISSINRQHEQIFGKMKSVIETLSFQPPQITQINNLYIALSDISSQLAAVAAQQKNWSILEDFEKVTEHALEFTETIKEESEEEQKRQFQILLTLVLTFFSKHKKLGISALFIIDILLRFTTFHQYYAFLQTKPELATKQELEQVEVKQDSTISFIQQISEQLKQAKEYRITNRPCFARLKPKKKTFIISKIPIDYEVIVIRTNHKWAYVSFFDPKDNLPQTGWIKKKYLNKPK